jgi:MATE family multidrug resistance protein
MVLAAPLIGAQLLQTGNGLIDVLVSARLGREPLAAGGIGAGMWFFASLSCIGLMAGLSPTLSKMIGERRRAAVGEVFRNGLWLAVLVGLVALMALLVGRAWVDQTALQPELLPYIRAYLLGACWSLPAFAIIMACRNVFEATGITRPVLLVQILGLSINLVGDLALGLGWFGFPRLGMFGIGLVTTVVMCSMAVALLWFLRGQLFQRYRLFERWQWPNWPMLGNLLWKSVPIYLGLVFEAGLFFATALQMGMIGALEAAAHNISISIASVCYMLPLGLSFVLTARVGRVYGRQLMAPLRLRVASGLLLMLMMTTVTMLLLMVFRVSLAGLYSDDTELTSMAAGLLILAALFQLSDGAQVALIGLLRGLQDLRVPMLINAVSYWGIAFPLGYYAAHHAGLGAYGLWLGLIIGLTVASVLLGWRLHNRLRVVQANWAAAHG